MYRLLFILVLVMPAVAVAWPDYIPGADGPDPDTDAQGGTAQTVAASGCRAEALGLAAGEKHYNFGTYRLQGSAGLGYFDGCSAANFGLAIRFPDRSIIWSGSVGITEGGDTGYSAGANWVF